MVFLRVIASHPFFFCIWSLTSKNPPVCQHTHEKVVLSRSQQDSRHLQQKIDIPPPPTDSPCALTLPLFFFPPSPCFSP